jgi:hypothetical protein
MFHQPGEATTMKITTIGLDLAKNVIQVHGVDEQGKAVLRKQLRRNQVATFFANQYPGHTRSVQCSLAARLDLFQYPHPIL